MRRITVALLGAVLLAGACASPYDGEGNNPGKTSGHFGGGLSASRVAGR